MLLYCRVALGLTSTLDENTASQVDAEKAVAEGWWYKPPYIINELNINSAVVYPRHGEVVSFD